MRVSRRSLPRRRADTQTSDRGGSMSRTKSTPLAARAVAWMLGAAGSALAMGLAGVAGAADRPVYLDPSAPLEVRVSDLLGRLTLDEKIALMAGGSSFGTAPVPRLGVPS